MKQEDKINCFQIGNSSIIKDFLKVQSVQKCSNSGGDGE